MPGNKCFFICDYLKQSRHLFLFIQMRKVMSRHDIHHLYLLIHSVFLFRIKQLKMEKKDIATEADIQVLVDTFYEKVLVDPVIGFIFTDVVQLSWEKHIPIMYTFWASILLGNHSYSGNPMTKHIDLDKKITLTQEHFDRWMELWEANVQAHFTGDIANEAINRARMIAPLMLHKVTESRR